MDLSRAREADPICESWAGSSGLTVRFTAPYEADHLFAENNPRPAAASQKVGRNQPCPCGSGKKYKKCCLPALEAAAPPSPAPVHERDQDLVTQMRRYAKRRFGEAWARAAGDFADAAQSVQLFGPWSVYGFEVEGRPIVGWFLEECGARLDTDERAWLLAQQRSWLSIWEVLAVEPGKTVTVRDLLSGEQRCVHEVRGSAVLVPRDTMLGRVVDHQGREDLGPATAAQHRWRGAALHHGPLLLGARRARRRGSTFARAGWGAASGGKRRGLLLVPAIGKRDAQGLGEHRDREGLGFRGCLEAGVEFHRARRRVSPPHRRGMHGPAPPPSP